MTQLSVNINKIATLRNARGGNMPNVLKAALDCEQFGAQGITVHPRPDERHIRYHDVLDLSTSIKTELNIEGYPTPEFIDLVLTSKPHQVTLVPDPPNAITSNAGWDVKKHFDFLTEVVQEFNSAHIRTSIFVDTDCVNLDWCAKTGTNRVEFYTEDYALKYPHDQIVAIQPYVVAANHAVSLNLGINAGHDLSLENLNYLIKNIPHINEVSIGHALICDALYLGLEKTIDLYLKALSV